MTLRFTYPDGDQQKSPIEIATENVMAALDQEITHQHQLQRVDIPEKEFRRIIALYFHRKELPEWCEDLYINAPDES